MKTVEIRGFSYEVIKNVGECFSLEETLEKVTDYFDSYDYIFGDYSYDKLRLKGFNSKENKNYQKINAIEMIYSYIEEFCSYVAKYFLLKKVK